MCGRFTLHTEKELLARRFEVDLEGIELVERYNIAPTDAVLAVRIKDGDRAARYMRWGLIPHWAKPLERLPSMINARVETVATRPAYRDSFRRKRCLIPADGFYEWQAGTGPRGTKTPHWIALRSGEPFAMAGIWATWFPPGEPDAAPVVSCAIVTAPANALVRTLHDRMPVILTPERAEAWIDPGVSDPGRLQQLLVPVESDALFARPVSTLVNSTDNDGPELIAPAEVAAPRLL